MDKIKAKIQSLCPDVMAKSGTGRNLAQIKPITLAVVLRAIKKVSVIKQREWDTYQKAIVVIVERWNLEHDNFDDQDKPTQDFIGNLLGV